MKISSILLSPEGERTIVHYETPHEHILQTDKDLKSLENTKIVYMSNLWRVPLDERKRILSHLAKKKILTIVNLGIADCRRNTEQLEALLSHVNILILNTHEFAELVKKPLASIHFKKDVIHLFPCLKTKILVITDGSKGAYAYVDGGILFDPALHVSKIADTTGAGDAFSAGFIAGYLGKANIEFALRIGNRQGALVVQKIGAN
jgi:ribokinase